MELNTQKVKLVIGRTLLRLMPFILMSALTLATFWLVQKILPLKNLRWNE
jgi:lipopolysaccharide export system protein LptC